MNNITRQRPIISDQVAEAAASDNLVPPLSGYNLLAAGPRITQGPSALSALCQRRNILLDYPPPSADVSIPIQSEVHIGILNHKLAKMLQRLQIGLGAFFTFFLL